MIECDPQSRYAKAMARFVGVEEEKAEKSEAAANYKKAMKKFVFGE